MTIGQVEYEHIVETLVQQCVDQKTRAKAALYIPPFAHLSSAVTRMAVAVRWRETAVSGGALTLSFDAAAWPLPNGKGSTPAAFQRYIARVNLARAFSRAAVRSEFVLPVECKR